MPESFFSKRGARGGVVEHADPIVTTAGTEHDLVEDPGLDIRRQEAIGASNRKALGAAAIFGALGVAGGVMTRDLGAALFAGLAAGGAAAGLLAPSPENQPPLVSRSSS